MLGGAPPRIDERHRHPPAMASNMEIEIAAPGPRSRA
jgi:hypothetical protein